MNNEINVYIPNYCLKNVKKHYFYEIKVIEIETYIPSD